MLLRWPPKEGARQLQVGAGLQKKPTTQAQRLPTCCRGERGWRCSLVPCDLISHFDLMKPQKNPHAAGLGRVSDLGRRPHGRRVGPSAATRTGQLMSFCTSAADRSCLSFIINYSHKGWDLLVLWVLLEDSWTWRGSRAVPNWLTLSSGCQNWIALLDAHLVSENWRIGELFGVWDKNWIISKMQAKDRWLSTTAVSRTLRSRLSQDPFNVRIPRNRNTNRKFINFPSFLPAECITFLKNVCTWKKRNENETLDRETDLCRVTAEPPLVILHYCSLSGLGDTQSKLIIHGCFSFQEEGSKVI